MNDTEFHKLLFGPYKAPPLRKGDRADCLYRDCLVRITSWWDAPIPWPRGRPVGAHSGQPGLLVDDELARAIRHESAAAVAFWWRVSHKTVAHWRAALGVGRMDNEGTNRLITAALECATDVWQQHEWTEEEREQRRRRAIERGCFVGIGYNGPRRWKPEQLALLGTLPDAEVARLIGKTEKAINVMRKRLGIPTAVDRRLKANRT